MASGIDLPSGEVLAFRRVDGAGPEVVFLPGYRSDMTGRKATALFEWGTRRGRAVTALDYRGHGVTGGSFETLTLNDWLDDVLAVVDRVARHERLILVGSSMGGWLMLLAAQARPERVRGLVGIAAAPDFTRRLAASLDMAATARDGTVRLPSRYGEPMPFTRRLIDDGERHCLLDRPVPFDGPVHLLHGQLDQDVPFEVSVRLAAQLTSRAVTLELVADGDHRLSREIDLRRITAAIERVTALTEGRSPAESD